MGATADRPKRTVHNLRGKAAAFWLIVITGANFFLFVQNAGEGDRIKAGVEANNRKFCSVIATTLRAAKAAGQPTSPYGRQQLANFEDLYRDFDCPGSPDDYSS